MRTGFSNFLYKLTHWESWHHHAKYIPLLPVWIWYCIRSRSLWFFTASNPGLTFGGMDGEGKEEMYNGLPPGTYPKSIYISPSSPFDEVVKTIISENLKYPFAAKPNVGMMGFMFRKIYSREDLEKYHKKIPVKYLLQDFIDAPVEVCVFYYRHPASKKGTISGMAKKENAEVTGDGHSSLYELIQKHPGVRFNLQKMYTRHKQYLHNILPNGEIYNLSDATNRSQGGKMVGLNVTPSEKLCKLFDDISNYSGSFFYGRYDIKCSSVKDFLDGKNFIILEYNGSGSGIQHIYGNGTGLFAAWQVILHHWKMLYSISKYNNELGVPYWEFWKGLKFLRKAKQNLEMLKKLDAEFPAF